jgi:Domain of Unknown Function (DUF928)
MVRLTFSQLQKILGVVLAVVAQHTPLLAQTMPENRLPTPQQEATFAAPPPPDNGAPTQREGAASRGPCVGASKSLTALVPLVKHTSVPQNAAGVVLGKTAASHPSLWFYVPYTLTSDHPLEFVLQDEAGKEIYSTALKASETKPGVVGFKLPTSVPALESGKRYRWFFSVYCNQDSPVIVTGFLDRVALNPSLVDQLEQATATEKVALYRKSDLWHEALTTLAELRRQNPEEAQLKAEWTDLLQSIGLKAIAPEPLTAILTQSNTKIEVKP